MLFIRPNRLKLCLNFSFWLLSHLIWCLQLLFVLNGYRKHGSMYLVETIFLTWRPFLRPKRPNVGLNYSLWPLSCLLCCLELLFVLNRYRKHGSMYLLKVFLLTWRPFKGQTLALISVYGFYLAYYAV